VQTRDRSLNRDEIVAAAHRRRRDGGLTALSVRSLAEDLGVAPMSL
jgi:hypothetical protein